MAAVKRLYQVACVTDTGEVDYITVTDRLFARLIRLKRDIAYELECEAQFIHPTKLCFLCSNELGSENLVYWIGADAQIWLHAECARELASHLIADTKRLRN